MKITNDGHLATAQLDMTVDENTIQKIREEIDEFINKETFGSFVFDFAQTVSIDETVIGMLLGRYKKLKQLGVKIGICNAKGEVDFTLSVSGIYTIIRKIN